MNRPKSLILICLSLFALVAWAFWPALHNDFVHYDDPLYVTGNAEVRAGLTLESIRWAFVSSVAANWHPITMLSHMLDVQFFGLNPRGHHATSVFLHALNAALLFLLLQRMTGALWRSLFVALVFGLHPLRVESVAWVAERKDVLSTFFGLLSLIAYAAYAKEKAESRKQKAETEKGQSVFSVQCSVAKWYALTALFFVLGLMSKPMLVTWPFVMLLLDYWPLGRFGVGSAVQDSMFDCQAEVRLRCSKFVFLFREKLPFFALTITASVITFLVQKAGGAVETIARLPLEARLQNAIVAYARYLAKFFWPKDLSVVYLYPTHWPALEIALLGALLAGISGLVWFLHRSRPYLVTGWLWFVGTLVPVIGLVQVGERLMADRYTYVPLIGVAIVLAWAGHELMRALHATKTIQIVIAAALLVPCIGLTRQQIGYWKDGETLFAHALSATDNNYVAHLSLGLALAGKGDYTDAINHYREALRLKPDYTRVHSNLGASLGRLGRLDEAILEFQKAVELEPNSATAHYNLGAALFLTRRLDDALLELQEAVKLNPNYAEAHCNLGAALGAKGQVDDAILHFKEALRLKPDYPEAWKNLQFALSSKASSPNRLPGQP